jgi:hypothetical protein
LSYISKVRGERMGVDKNMLKDAKLPLNKGSTFTKVVDVDLDRE